MTAETNFKEEFKEQVKILIDKAERSVLRKEKFL